MPKPNSPFGRVLILGLGRAGKSLALTFLDRGFPVTVWDRDVRKAGRFARAHGCAAEISQKWRCDPSMVIIAVADGAVAEVAKLILKAGMPPSSIVHLSGVLSLQPLLPLKRAGWHVGKWHPIFSFPVRPAPLPKGVMFGYRGGSASMDKAILALCRRLDGGGIRIRPGADAAYHLACVAAGNFLFAQMDFARRLLRRSLGTGRGADAESLLLPLIFSSLDNMKRDGLKGGLTGPWARGDRETMRLHRAYLKRSAPDLLPFYREAGRLLERLTSGWR